MFSLTTTIAITISPIFYIQHCLYYFGTNLYLFIYLFVCVSVSSSCQCYCPQAGQSLRCLKQEAYSIESPEHFEACVMSAEDVL